MSTWRRWIWLLLDDEGVAAPVVLSDRHSICVPALSRSVTSTAVRRCTLKALSRIVLVPEQEAC